MEKYIIRGGSKLNGDITIRGAKNVALKICFVSLLTDDELIINNVPDILDVHSLLILLSHIGIENEYKDHTLRLKRSNPVKFNIPLEIGARLRTSSLVLGPLLARYHQAVIPNPGGCRLGARPIDWHINALIKMGAKIEYNSEDGFFHAQCEKLVGTTIQFEKNSHTGTESVILAAVLADGKTVIQNAAAEIEIDDLINCLNSMGARITRTKPREIEIEGVEKLHGTTYSIMSDRNEEVTYAIAAALTHGKIRIHNSLINTMDSFAQVFSQMGGIITKIDENTTEYQGADHFLPASVTTQIHPGFMTDWQGPLSVLMTQADGESTLHETVFENRFGYVSELIRMGADITYFNPEVTNPDQFYNFHWQPQEFEKVFQAIKIKGPARLHNAVLNISDLRAGATLILAALIAEGETQIYGVEHVDRGYEQFETQLASLGASIIRVKEEI